MLWAQAEADTICGIQGELVCTAGSLQHHVSSMAMLLLPVLTPVSLFISALAGRPGSQQSKPQQVCLWLCQRSSQCSGASKPWGCSRAGCQGGCAGQEASNI